MPRIFISYRRADTITITGRIYDRLVAAFSEDNVFKDVDDIPLGADFREVLEREVAKCDVLLAIIGQQWASIPDNEGAPRIRDANDFVRIEVEAGVHRDDVVVIPVLVSGAAMPTRDLLPASLSELAFRNAAVVRDDPDFNHDISRLIEQINRQFAPAAAPPPATPIWRSRSRLILSAALAAVVLIAALIYGYASSRDPGTPTATAAALIATSTATHLATITPATEAQMPTATAVIATMTLRVSTATPMASKQALVNPTPTAALNQPAADTTFSLVYPLHREFLVLSRFGDSQPNLPTPHDGIDFVNTEGNRNVYAAHDGTVIRVASITPNNALYVTIEHPEQEETWVTWYMNLVETDVELGQSVTAGQLIGSYGTASSSIAPFLHFALQRIGAGVSVYSSGGMVDPQPYFEPESTATSTAAATSAQVLRFVADVTIPDNTQLAPGTEFTKIWQIVNAGGEELSGTLDFDGGTPMTDRLSIPLPPLAPDETGDVAVMLTAPTAPGTYRSTWRAHDSNGVAFDYTLYVEIVVTGGTTGAPATPQSSP